MPSANFDKVCKRCSKRKHINEFRRNKNVNAICNSCIPTINNHGNKKCPQCGKDKFINAFIRNSMKCTICNKCYEMAIEKSASMFKLGFEVMNRLEKRIEECIRQ